MASRCSLVGVLGLAAGVACGGMTGGGGHFASQPASPAPSRSPEPVVQGPVVQSPGAGTQMPTVIAPVVPQPEPPQPDEPRESGGAPASYTFKLRNDGATDLLFSNERGWQPVIFAYSGKPPAAHSAQFFPTECTASCDAADPCPVCAPLGAVAKAVAVPGASVDVPWDGSVFVYTAPTAAAKKSCRCWNRHAVEPGQYNVKACGLRVPAAGGRSSHPTCAETTLSVPANGHTDVTLEFTK